MITLYWLLGFVLPTQLGSYVFFENTYVGGIPVDFLSFKLFLPEVLSAVLIILFLCTHKLSLKGRNFGYFTLILLFFLFVSRSVWTTSFALIGWISSLAFGLLIFQAKDKYLKALLGGLSVIGLVQLFLAIFQFSVGKSIGGIAYLLGERFVTLAGSNVATITLGNIERLRAYGSFSHPNSLAGFGVVAFWLLWRSNKKVTSLQNTGALAWLLCVFLSFSRAGAMALVLSLVVVVFKVRTKWLVIASVLAAVSMLFASNLGLKVSERAISERLLYLRSASEVITKQPLFGVGVGNFIPGAFLYSKEYSFKYSYQPVHNIWILALSEVGFVGLIILFSIWRYLYKRGVPASYVGAVAGILVTGTFDHYWLTLVQNRLLLVMVLCLLLRENRKDIWKMAKKSR